jgi:hypothetical protein
MKHNNNCEQKVFFLKNADYQYLYNCDRKPDLKLVKLFKSKSPWKDKAIAEIRASFEESIDD